MAIHKHEDPVAFATNLLDRVLEGYHPWQAHPEDDSMCNGTWAQLRSSNNEYVMVQVPDEALEEIIDYLATIAGRMDLTDRTMTYKHP